MKVLRNAVVLLASTCVSSQALAASCNICPDGITLEENIAPCESAIAASNMLEEGSDACSASKLTYDMMCCPAPIANIIADAANGVNISESNPPSLGLVGIDADVDPCTICPDGVTISESYPSLGFADSNETSLEEAKAGCEELISTYFTTYNADSEFCSAEIKMTYGRICCPAPLDDLWALCPDGISVSENNLFGASREEIITQCEQSITFLGTYEASSAFCTEETKQTYEMMCCPTPLDNPCTICPNGVSLSESSLIFLADNNETSLQDIIAGCEQSITFLATYEDGSDICTEETKQTYEMMCCPTPLDNPCTICPDGVSLSENNPFLLGDSDETSLEETKAQCEQSIAFLATYEDGSDICTEETKQTYEMMCCPTPLDNPCTICPDGVSISGSILVVLADNNETTIEEIIAGCEQAIDMMVLFESSSEMCADELKESYEMTCCPTPVDDPCSVCDGVSLSENPVPGFGDCEGVVDYAKFLESDSDFCNDEMKFYELLCCPTAAMDPCSICPEGYIIEEYASAYDTNDSTIGMEGIGITCGQVVLNIEEGSNQCSMAKEDMDLESNCCSALVDSQLSSANSTVSIKDPTNMTLPTSSPADEQPPSNKPSESSAQASSNPTIASDTATPENDSAGTGSPIMTPSDPPSETPSTSSVQASSTPTIAPDAATPENDSVGTGSPIVTSSDPPSKMPASKDSAAAPTMGVLISISLVLVTIHALAWVL